MEHEELQRGPVDQQAALEELERFGRDIQRYREQRQALGDEFETFIRSFKTPPPPDDLFAAPAIAAPAAPGVEPPPLIRTSPRPAVLPSPVEADTFQPPTGQPAVAGTAAPVPEGGATAAPPAYGITPPIAARDEAIGDTARPPSDPPRAMAARPRPGVPTVVLIGGALVVTVVGVLLMRGMRAEPPQTTPTVAVPQQTAAAPAPVPPAQEPAPAAAAAAPAAPAAATAETAITTVRRVWMRVTVDGQRVLEREVPGGTTIPLKAQSSIVIRTGDAGAVRLAIGGQDRGLLGAEGEVVTRSFTVPPAGGAVPR